jgi:hypothetical protein
MAVWLFVAPACPGRADFILYDEEDLVQMVAVGDGINVSDNHSSNVDDFTVVVLMVW